MTKTNVHIINHTHWDREWFLTSVYTSQWIPGLIDKLEELAAANPDFHFLFDGQTLVMEDLLAAAPAYAEKVKALVGNGRLLIGPYYCQPDWQLTSGELLIRNLQYGQKDTQQLGGSMKTGWLVDTFGHISQSPQIHSLFGIDAVYVWRGVPEMTPYFHWQSPDGSQLLTINLFGGYRNLYGVTHVPEVALPRLHTEVEKLRPYYPTPDIPLFDGYDLEDNPEDPYRFLTSLPGIRPDITLQEATPVTFAQTLRQKGLSLPTIAGELNSGKYGAVFPGTLSARTYLKVMARDCEQQLFQLCEPLAVLAWLKGRPYPEKQHEQWARMLLQNAVHDCICGVSIDQVHEKMAYSYRQIADGLAEEIQASLNAILHDFAPGEYAISTNPFACDMWQVVDEETLVHVNSAGVGVWPVVEKVSAVQVDESAANFVWENSHYTATVAPSGQVQIGQGTLGTLAVFAEHGDLYSDETGAQLGTLTPVTPPRIVARSRCHCEVAFSAKWQQDARWVSADVRLLFDQSPLVRWTIDLNSQGTDLCVEMVFQPGYTGTFYAGMPFDMVKRPAADRDLLPRELPDALASVLLGQRELNVVNTFPFHDMVSVTNGVETTAVFAKGVHAYRSEETGTLSLTLRRTAEWLTAANLQNRVGDAGPFFYVPDGRCERTVRHEVAAAVGQFPPEGMALQQLNAAYQNPPLVVRKAGAGTQMAWPVVQEDLPLSALFVAGGEVFARFYNPTGETRPFTNPYVQTDVWGEPAAQIDSVSPKKIVTVKMPYPRTGTAQTGNGRVTLLTPLPWRVGPNTSLPDPAILAQLAEKMDAIDKQLADIDANMAASQSRSERLYWQREHYVLAREKLEFALSHALNVRKMADNNQLKFDYLYRPDGEIADIGLKLNRLRIKRRIFDYVVQVE